MITISLCMIVKDEEDVLARCLQSVKGLADEIIIVDTGSSDRTVEIARAYTEKIYFYPWQDDFSAARNFSFSKAEMEYCMWLDADDVIKEKDREELLKLKEELDSSVDVVMLPYQTGFDSAGRPTFCYFRERILRRCSKAFWQGRVHEAISRWGKVEYGKAAVSHYKLKQSDSERNLRIYEKQLADGEAFSPRDQFYYGRELYYHRRWQESASVLESFLKEGRGWLENNIEACRFLSYCLLALKEEEKALEALLRTFQFDEPRAEVCCELGRYFLERKALKQAIFWYELALTRHPDPSSGAFISEDCYGYLPAIQLCVCYDSLGQREKAREYNEQAAAFKPESEAVQANRLYFAALADH